MNKASAPVRTNDSPSTNPGVSLAPTDANPAAPSADEHAGKGGMYQLVDGRRELVERTAQVPAPAKAD
ncbi:MULTISPECIES: hypothetical protein [unclassified Variovorax]|uniref:hypothetical protein n=1 Tax=unclassified Variovorax TaxID=663243 RepID=UPI003F487044